MDIDCDGAQSEGNGDCKSSNDTQGQTTFSSIVAGYGKGISDVDAYIHSYVVLGNQGSKDGYVNYDPQSAGIQPLSIVAVVCGDKLVRIHLIFHPYVSLFILTILPLDLRCVG